MTASIIKMPLGGTFSRRDVKLASSPTIPELVGRVLVVDDNARARQSMPGGQFVSGSPAELDPTEPWQVVLCRTFASFPDADYARGVLARMAAKATHAVAILEIPESRYDRRWILRAFAEIGVSALQMEEVKAGVDLKEARYHVFARL